MKVVPVDHSWQRSGVFCLWPRKLCWTFTWRPLTAVILKRRTFSIWTQDEERGIIAAFRVGIQYQQPDVVASFAQTHAYSSLVWRSTISRAKCGYLKGHARKVDVFPHTVGTETFCQRQNIAFLMASPHIQCDGLVHRQSVHFSFGYVSENLPCVNFRKISMRPKAKVMPPTK